MNPILKYLVTIKEVVGVDESNNLKVAKITEIQRKWDAGKGGNMKEYLDLLDELVEEVYGICMKNTKENRNFFARRKRERTSSMN